MDEKASPIVNGIIAGFVIIPLSIFFYTLYRSSHHPPGQMTKFYIVSIASALFFAFVLFKCSAEIKAKISLFMLSSILGIYTIEFILSYNNNIKPEYIRAKLAKEAGKPYDTRHRIQVWIDMRSKGIDAYPLYNPYTNMELKDTDILPLSFISRKTAIFCNEGGKYITYKTDEHGFNNPEGLYNIKNIDNVLIGDSFAQGACVKPEENIAGWLRKDGFEVLNLGVLNSAEPNQLAILKEYAKPSEPDVVFWLFYEGNDHEGLEFEKKSRIFPKYLKKNFSQNLISKQDIIDEMLIKELEKEFRKTIENKETLKKILESSKGGTFDISWSSITLPNLRSRLGLSDMGCYSLYDPLFKDYMSEAKRTVDEWGGRLVFLYLPAYYRYAEKINTCKIKSLDEGKKEVIKAVESLHIPIIDIQKTFDSNPDPLSFFHYRIFGHYNSKGYKAVSEQIENYLGRSRNSRAN